MENKNPESEGPKQDNKAHDPSGWKVILSRFIVRLQRVLNGWDKKLTGYSHNPNTDELEDMTATAFADNVAVYEDSLLWALRKPEIMNIAITGPFGSGKTSIIRTFQRKHQEFRFLYVSLAKFDETYKDDDDWRVKIELSIMQQLFYHVKNSRLPDSRFKKINKTTRWHQVIAAFCWLMWGIAAFMIYEPQFFGRFTWWRNIGSKTRDVLFMVALGLLLLGFAYGFYKLYRILKKIRFNKLGFVRGELELTYQDDTSIFNKHLDEIIYFFEVTPIDVIVIEDLDRLKDPEIFTKIREINFLVNNSEQVNRHVKFLYALKDDMFADEGRTKFFDFMIPVIPVINTTNSADKLIKKLESTGIDKKFIRAVSLYVDDMRTLKNIVNEFKLYKKVVADKLDQKKLLAIIIYKNLNPTEFEKLHGHRQGEIFELFNAKREFIQEKIERINNQIEDLREELKKYEQSAVRNIAELLAVYLMKIFEKIPSQHALIDNGTPISLQKANSEEFFASTIERSAITVKGQQSFHPRNIGIDFKAIEHEVDPDHTYEERKEEVLSISNNGIEKAQQQIDELTQQKNRLAKSALKDVITNDDSFEFPPEFKNKPLLVYLVRNGHIDESYPSYISHFYEGSMTQKDREFVLSVMNRDPLDFDVEINNFELVTERLLYHNYAQPAVLNFSYFDWLVKSESTHKSELIAIYKQLANKSERSREFIDGCMNNSELLPTFIPALCTQWPGFWNYLAGESQYPQEKLDRYLLTIVKYCPPETVMKLNSEGQIVKYIVERKDFFRMDGLAKVQQEMIDVVEKLHIKFRRLEYVPATETLLRFIYANNHYEINAHNITVLALNMGKIDSLSTPDFERANYTSIVKSEAKDLKKFIDQNLEEYVKNVFLTIESNIHESEAIVISLLSNENLSNDLKKDIIAKEEMQFDSFDPIPFPMWGALLENNKITISWQNLFTYFKENDEIDEYLAASLNNVKNSQQLSRENLKTFEEKNEGTDEFLKAILQCEELEIQPYKHLVDRIYYSFDDLEIGQLSSDKVGYLISTGTLQFTLKYFEIIKGTFPSQVVPYIESNIEKLLGEAPIPSIPIKAYIPLIRSQKLKYEQTLAILETLDLEGIKSNHELGGTILRFMLDNAANISNKEIPLVLILLSQPHKLDSRLSLLIHSIRIMEPESKAAAFSSLGSPYSELLANGQYSMKIPNNELNKNLLAAMQSTSTGMISSFNERKKNLLVYFKRKS